MRRRLRSWLTGLLAGLFVLALLPLPHVHAKAVLERAALAHAVPDAGPPNLRAGNAPADHPHGGTHAAAHDGTHDGTHDGLPHPHVPSCFACVVMASPGLASSGFLVAGRIALPVPAALDPPAAAPRRHVAWTPQSARAPPAGSIV